MYVEYSSNNSGGGWWLDDDDWRALEKAGWRVKWEHLDFEYSSKGDYTTHPPTFIKTDKKEGERWLGALAQYAFKDGVESLQEAVEEWERVTGESSTNAGCSCCGQPHAFTLYDDEGKYLDSGPSIEHTCSW